MKKEDLKPYKMAQQLRKAANRCVRQNADVTLLCEQALHAAEWLENEAADLERLSGSVTHATIGGQITVGCVLAGMTSNV